MTTYEDESKVKGVQCHFPFVYKKIIYNDCTKVDSEAYWGSTKVQGITGNHKAGNWGLCNSSCPKGGN